MALPLPKVVADVGPGGPAVTALGGMNALSDAMLKTHMQSLKNKFLPLEEAVKAQNSMAYGSRLGNIGNYLRSISEMPVAERQAYLSDPTNRANYMNMVENFRSGINNPQNTNILTPQFLSQFGMGNGNPNALMQNNNAPPAMPSNNMLNSGGASAPTQGMPAPTPMPMQDADNSQMPQDPGSPPPMPAASVPAPAVPDVPEAAPMPPEAPTLTQKERDNLSAQKRTNNLGLSRPLLARADAAIAFEKTLQDAQPYLAKAYQIASKYNQYGKVNNWLQKLKQDQPDEYADYIFAKNSATPILANGVRFLENMGISHEAQEDAKNLIAQIDKLDVSPITAQKSFNKTMQLLSDVSEGVLNSAEPTYPGTRRKLAGLKKLKGDYIKGASPTNSDLEHTAKKYNMTVDQVKQKLGLR